jgi:hypothetical protein
MVRWFDPRSGYHHPKEDETARAVRSHQTDQDCACGLAPVSSKERQQLSVSAQSEDVAASLDKAACSNCPTMGRVNRARWHRIWHPIHDKNQGSTDLQEDGQSPRSPDSARSYEARKHRPIPGRRERPSATAGGLSRAIRRHGLLRGGRLERGREVPFWFRKPHAMNQTWADAPDVRCCPKSSGEHLPRWPTPNSFQSVHLG